MECIHEASNTLALTGETLKVAAEIVYQGTPYNKIYRTFNLVVVGIC